MTDEESVTVPRSDPIYSVWIWRQDSITLARLRPTLEQIVATAGQPCFFAANLQQGSTCLEVDHLRPCASCYCRTLLSKINI